MRCQPRGGFLVDGWWDRCERWLCPPCCVLCGGEGGVRDLCRACEEDLPYNEPACPRCAVPTPTGELCGTCRARPPRWDGAFSLLRYAYPADGLIKALKYRHRLAVGRVLGGLMAERLSGSPPPDLIVPVPLHPSRECERGFNQATELARPVAAMLGVRMDTDLVRRLLATPSQSGLDRRARRHNLRRAFAVRRTLEGEHVAIVDDVVTTGATAAELVATLRRAGARRIEIWSGARAAR
jgi:ComF family protein